MNRTDATRGGYCGVVLGLLAEWLAVGLLRELDGERLQPSDLKQRLPEAGHSALMRRLGEMVRGGAVVRERVADVPPRAYYALTEAGGALLPIVMAAEAWERRWPPQVRAVFPGGWALRLLADTSTQSLLLALADGALRPIELDRCAPRLGRSATRRRLGHLHLNGILARQQDRGEVRYSLSASARDLEPIALLATQWQRQWRPVIVSPPASAAAPPARARP